MMASTGGLRGITSERDKFDVRHRVPAEGRRSSAAAPAAPVWRSWPARPPEKQEAAFKFIAFATSTGVTTFWSQNTGYMPVRKSAVESEEMQAFFAENPNFKTAVDQLPKTQPQDAARVFIPNGDQIIGKGLERITVNNEDAAGRLRRRRRDAHRRGAAGHRGDRSPRLAVLVDGPER